MEIHHPSEELQSNKAKRSKLEREKRTVEKQIMDHISSSMGEPLYDSEDDLSLEVLDQKLSDILTQLMALEISGYYE